MKLRLKYRAGCSGHTLPELIIVLALMGLIIAGGIGVGVNIVQKQQERSFYAETENLLDQIIEARNKAMMTNNIETTITVYPNKMTVKHFEQTEQDIETAKAHSALMSFETMTADVSNGSTTITFSKNGTIGGFDSKRNRGGAQTIHLMGPNGCQRDLVLQPVTGRIYLTDEK